MNLCTAMYYLRQGYAIRTFLKNNNYVHYLKLKSHRIYINGHNIHNGSEEENYKPYDEYWEASIEPDDLEYNWEIYYGDSK